MDEQFVTQTGERPDLAAIEVNPPEGYIGDMIYPIVPVKEKSIYIAYATVTADSAAQTGRVAAAAPTLEQITDSETTATCTEIIDRIGIVPDEAKQMGSIEKADRVGASKAKRNVANKHERNIRDALFSGAADATFDPGKISLQVQVALEAVRLYEGPRCMVASTKVLKAMVLQLLGDSKLGPVFSRLISGTSPSVAMTGYSLRAYMDALQIYFGVDKILPGADTVWNEAESASREKIAIAVLDDGTDEYSHKFKPVLGKCFRFLPDGSQPWKVRSAFNEDTLNNTYTAFLWEHIETLNDGAVYIIDGVPTT
jgi:hypothetical protein